jgi:tetratricopeptide (TPR) repeat protein
MAQLRRATLLGSFLVLALVLPARGLFAGAAPVKEEPKPAQQQLTPEEQAAKDLLDRVRVELKVQEQQKRHLADQHFKVAKAHFDQGDWKAAYPHLLKAVELDPAHTEAQDLLKKTRGFVGVKEGKPDIISAYLDQRSVGIDMRKLELANLMAEARAAFEKGDYLRALQLFIQAKAKAQALAPSMDVGKAAEDSEVCIQKSQAAIQAQRAKEEQERLRRAKEETDKLRKQGQSLLDERQRARFVQAQGLFEQRRYEEARKLCEQILRETPGNGAAETLRTKVVESARREAIDRLLATRRDAMDRYWDETRVGGVPQTGLVAMPRELFEKVRSRKEQPIFFGDVKPPEEWEARVREAMNKRVSFDFVETPLQDVLSFLGSFADVGIILDQDAIKGQNPQVTLRVKDMRLETAMNWICKLTGLRYTLKNEALFISNSKGIHDTTVLRMFDVSDLTVEIKNFKGRQRALATDSGRGEEGGGGLSTRDFFPDEEEEKEEDSGFTGKSLIEFIKKILGGQWDEDAAEKVGDVLGLPKDARGSKGQELVDLIGITIGGRTFLAMKTRE